MLLVNHRFFDFSKVTAKRAFRVIQVCVSCHHGLKDVFSETCRVVTKIQNFIPLNQISFHSQDTHNVRSVSYHPSGDFLLAGTFM